VRINMSKVWSGLQPDVFLRPDDTIEVGTDMLAPFITLVRDAPSLTTGVGFSYQRNLYTGVNPL
jgi:polysaccharide biosynthesis/export protein